MELINHLVMLLEDHGVIWKKLNEILDELNNLKTSDENALTEVKEKVNAAIKVVEFIENHEEIDVELIEREIKRNLKDLEQAV